MSQSENIAHNLSGTQRMSITKPVFLRSSWEDICGKLEPPKYLVHVLQMTSLLRELSLDYLHPGSWVLDKPTWDFEMLFRCEIRERAVSDSSFLSHLVRLECPQVDSMLAVLVGRPIESISHPRDSNFTTNQSPSHLHALGASPIGLSVSVVISMEPALFPASITHGLRILKRALYKDIVIKHLKISVVGSRSEVPVPPDVQWPNWPLLWVATLAKAGGTEHLESLCIFFDPPLERNRPDMQQRALTMAAQSMPNLIYAVVGTPCIQWRRHVGHKSDPASRVPDWSPRPNCRRRNVHIWWLLKSGLSSTGIVAEEDISDVIIRLRSIMLTRWDDELVPDVEWLRRRCQRYRN